MSNFISLHARYVVCYYRRSHFEYKYSTYIENRRINTHFNSNCWCTIGFLGLFWCSVVNFHQLLDNVEWQKIIQWQIIQRMMNSSTLWAIHLISFRLDDKSGTFIYHSTILLTSGFVFPRAIICFNRQLMLVTSPTGASIDQNALHPATDKTWYNL